MKRTICRVIAVFCASVLIISAATQAAVAADNSELKPFPIGAVLAMTGSGAFYGKVMSRGLELAIKEINDAGGVAGYKLNLHTEDHKSGDTRAAISAARKLISVEKVPVIVSSYGGVTLSLQPMAARRDILVLNGGGTASTLIGKKDLYNTRMVAGQLTPIAVKWAVKHLNAKRIATIYYTTSSGRETNAAVKKACEKFGCQVVAEEPYKIGSTNFSLPLTRIKSANPDAVIVGAWGDDVGHIVKQAKENNISAQLVGLELLPNEMKIAGQRMDGYWAVFDRFSPDADNPATEHFVQAYDKAYSSEPGYYAANYYELVNDVIAPLIRKTVEEGQDPTTPGVLSGEMKKLVRQGFRFNSVYGGKLQLHANGSVTKPVGVFEVKNETPVLVRRVVDGEFVSRKATAESSHGGK